MPADRPTDKAHAGRIDNARRLLEIYQCITYHPTNPFPPPNAAARATALRAMIADLEQYAIASGIDLSNPLHARPAVYPDKRTSRTQHAVAAAYGVGDEVRLVREPVQCGTVIRGREEGQLDGALLYIVHVPGVPYLHAEQAARLQTAPPFPRVDTQLGVITRAMQAEEALRTLTATESTHAEPDRVDHTKLLTALSSWSGTPVHELHNDLQAKVNRPQFGDQPSPSHTGPASPEEAGKAPDLDDIPATDRTPAAQPQPKPSAGRPPGHAA